MKINRKIGLGLFILFLVLLLFTACVAAPQAKESNREYRPVLHIGPAEAVKAHIDLGTLLSIAAHYQVFRLGVEGFNDAVDVLVASLKEHSLKREAFVTPVLEQTIEIPPAVDVSLSPENDSNI